MASTRRTRIPSRRLSKLNEESPEKNEDSPSKNKRKRKLSDMLGSPWRKEELEGFYIAYRKYGRDWKKVAGALRNRSVDMVEALYNMNKAYLSLPEGTASVAGLIAMMTDHYNILEGSDSDQESNDDISTSQKRPKRIRGHAKLNSMGKSLTGSLPDLLQYHSVGQSNGSPSLIKKKRSGVGKRTPRFPISYSHDNAGIEHNSKRNLRTAVDSEDFDVARAALALAEASHRGGSPSGASAPGKSAAFSILDGQRKVKGASSSGRIRRSTAEKDYYYDSVGSRGAENGVFSKNKIGIGAVYKSRKGKNKLLKKPRSVDYEYNVDIDDVKEACSGTEEGLAYRAATEEEFEAEATNIKARHSSQFSKRRSRHNFSGDESAAADALQALADVSLNILAPTSPAESESSVQVREEEENVHMDEKPRLSAVFPPRSKRGKAKDMSKIDRPYYGPESSASKNVKSLTSYGATPVSEFNRMCELSASKFLKRKRKFSAEKNSQIDKDKELHLAEPCNFELLNQGKSFKGQENSLDSGSRSKTDVVLGESLLQISSTKMVNLYGKRINRRKMHLKNVLAQKRGRLDVTSVERAKLIHMPYRVADSKKEIVHGLSSPLLRRWCAFEWFYSAIDFPWFGKNEFVEYLNHAQLGTLPSTLTRAEWGVIRSALGKPRRFSEQFLREERKKLGEYREHVRATYANLCSGLQEGLPTDLARPLSVGQRVIARHSKTRELHDGSVLTVDRHKCRIQFDKPELGVELVMDIDSMPLDPLENLPKALKMQNFASSRLRDSYGKVNQDSHLRECVNKNPAKDATSEALQTLASSAPVPIPIPNFNSFVRHAKGTTFEDVLEVKAAINDVAAPQATHNSSPTLAQIKPRDADKKALADLFHAVDRKEMLLAEVKSLHEEASFSRNQRGNQRGDFKDYNSQLDRQLKNVDAQISSALELLRDCNTTNKIGDISSASRLDNIVEALFGNSVSKGRSAFFSKDVGSHIVEIYNTSNRKARALVDVEVDLAIAEGKLSFKAVEGDPTNIQLPKVESNIPVVRNLIPDVPVSSNSTSCELLDVAGSEPKKNDFSNGYTQPHVPLDLMSSSVATLLMIQRCTEQQYPPGEVAHLLDSAITSLHPCCPENLPLYKDIEQCMGLIKTQVLALIPNQNI